MYTRASKSLERKNRTITFEIIGFFERQNLTNAVLRSIPKTTRTFDLIKADSMVGNAISVLACQILFPEDLDNLYKLSDNIIYANVRCPMFSQTPMYFTSKWKHTALLTAEK